MRGSRKLAAGLMDAALAALGTFLAGIVAVRELETRALVVYAVVFSASVFAMLLPRQLHYVPAQIGANLEPDLRSPVIRRDLRSALPANGLTVLVTVGAALSLAGVASIWTCLALGATAAAFSVVSPMQDHVRASLHLVDRHMSAAVCSMVLAATVSVGTVLGLANRGAGWLPLVPFGALLIGNGVSLVVGLALLRGADRHADYLPRALVERGRLLLSELAVQGAWFGCNYVLLFLLGPVVLARLEAARVVASPVTILTTALITFMGPAVLRALAPTHENPHGPRRHIIALAGALLIGGAGYAAVLAFAGPVVATVLDKPFVFALVAARIGAYAVEGVSTMVNLVVYTMGRTRLALGNSVVAGALGLVGTAVLAVPLGAFGLPAGQALGMTARLVSATAAMERTTARAADRLEPVSA